MLLDHLNFGYPFEAKTGTASRLEHLNPVPVQFHHCITLGSPGHSEFLKALYSECFSNLINQFIFMHLFVFNPHKCEAVPVPMNVES